ncbi:hopanoid biosynthesis-associated protein HpnK [Anaeromyxobacter oryzae]|uniref:Hydrolase n=1 Tax=Anaeromyxobacter oryzae TaxID=2918170 RepID=A0ABN6MMI1_9BACT|nr:hopanoid biosynthesis-associated protein HpnK [Anaeromyxobacter oryzae]BDG02226.1 hydrolase [Anaeromyxobacter oryzae]
MRADPAARAQATARPPLGHVLVTADDLGASTEVNAAVARAHRDGVLTGASLLVAGDALDEAVALARATPGLAVGLHLALADARPVLPSREVPHLVGADGRLLQDPARVFLRLASSAAARREAAREIAAQVDRFVATGLPLSHVDGHHHLHLHPAVFPVVAERAARAGARGIRLPWEGLAALPEARPRRAAIDAAVLGALARGWRGAARRLGLRFADRVHGIVRSGAMDAAYLLALVPRLGGGATELFLHPSTAPGDARGPNPRDLAALLDPAVRAALEARGLALATYAALERP